MSARKDPLQEAFQDPGDAHRRPDCPPAEVLVAGVLGELAPATLAPLLDHLVVCPVCTEAWRVVVAAEAEWAEPQPTRRRGPWLAALAGGLALAAASLLWLSLRPPTEPSWRGSGGGAEGGQVEATPGGLTLRWSPVAGAARYRVELFGPGLVPLVQGEATGPTWPVPPEGLEAGPPWVWRVEAWSAEGRSLGAQTFTFDGTPDAGQGGPR